ncbi:nucleotidyltransferase substrate binding protein, partial [bacterium]|nr:nucleotidyltransferase substrate binding protein [bacterium]
MEGNKKFQRAFEKFEKAFNKYKEVVGSPQLFNFLNEELIVEISTNRFEYTFEILWKTLKEYLKLEGIDCSTPLRCFNEAFKAGLINEKYEGIFIDMIEKRNEIVHIYDLDQAKSIYGFIKSDEV